MSERQDQQGENLAEIAYRRGYQHGANDTLMAADRLARGRVDLSNLRDWIGVTLYRWRRQPANKRIEPPMPPVA